MGKAKYAATFAASITLIFAGMSPASAQPPAEPPVSQDSWLSSLAALEKRVSNESGYSQIVVNDIASVTVQVKAGTPAAALELPELPSLSARLEATAFSLDELTAERDRITLQVKQSRGKVSQIGPSPNFDGIIIKLLPDATHKMAQAPLPTPSDLGITSTKIPITVQADPGEASATYSRFDSGGGSGQVLHIGGQRLKRGTVGCTAGVPVYDSATGKRAVLTAGHCGGVGSYWNDGVGYGYGPIYANTSSQTTASYDYALIENSSSTINIGEIYRGRTYENNTSRMAPDRVNAGLGMRLCASGSYSGEVCELGVTAVNQNVYYVKEDIWYNNLTQLASFGTYAGWGPGDSGGPVFYPNSNGTASIAGIVSGNRSGTPMPCREETGRECFKDLFMAPMGFIQDTRGLLISQGF